MRYEVVHEGDEWRVFDHEKDHYIMAHDGGLLESAAHIIAFALNSIAEGKFLMKQKYKYYKYYEGPTEGVAPNG